MVWYGFSLHPEPDAPEALRRLLGMMHSRYEDQFTPEGFRRFRDELSACGVDLREIETWTESKRTPVCGL